MEEMVGLVVVAPASLDDTSKQRKGADHNGSCLSDHRPG